MTVPSSQARLRSDVDSVLNELIVDDGYDLDIDVITVAGPLAARLRDVTAHLRKRAS